MLLNHMATILEDIHQDIIQKHILPRLDGPSLWTIATATASSTHLRSLCIDHKLWADVSMSTWPSITHPHVHQIISTFPKCYYSFFRDSFPSLVTYPPSKYLSNSHHEKDHSLPSELISLVDIRYKGNIIYSTAHFTNTTSDHFLSSPFQIVLNESTHVPEKFNDLEISNNEASLSLLKESVTLNWIIINPSLKRAGNLSIIKPVIV
uniref:F-box protein At2g27310-like n=1 Tax=Erigeron canadensis TaxID=72917 RepID=UPI001CB95205|nr:F-box protein At2g27310-like [Erigeron canadensis]